MSNGELKKVLLALGVFIAFVFTLCSAAMLVLALQEWQASRATPAATTPVEIEEATPRPLSTEARPGTPAEPMAPAETEALPPEIQNILRRLEREVEDLRGLKAKKPVAHQFLTTEELRQKVEEDFFKDYSEEDAFQDALELWTLGMLNRDFDLFNFYKAMYTDVIAGFYDDEEEVMYIVKDAKGLPANARMTYVHEFVHALQDQYWDLDKGLQYNDETCEQDTEYCAGVQALIEGDASYVEDQWFWTRATREEQREIIEYYRNLEIPVFDQAPEFMQKDLLFPYREGKDFVTQLYAQGVDAVNQAFANPPRSTEQILHPSRYPDDTPLKVQLPDLPGLLGRGWEPIVEYNALGEYWLYLMLGYGEKSAWRLSDTEAAQAAAGWAGDAYALYYNEKDDAIVFVMDLRWDTPEDGQEFAESLARYLQKRFGSPTQGEGYLEWVSKDFGLIRAARPEPTRVLWVMAPDAATLETLWRALEP